MKVESVILDDGQVQIRITGSEAELQELALEEEDNEFDVDALSAESPELGAFLNAGIKFPKFKNPFKNKTYCVRCENGTKRTIHARGRMAAAIRAATICNPYQLDKGGC